MVVGVEVEVEVVIVVGSEVAVRIGVVEEV